MTTLWVLIDKKQTAKCNTTPAMTSHWRRKPRNRFARQEMVRRKYGLASDCVVFSRSGAFFPAMRGRLLGFCECELAYRTVEREFPLDRRDKKLSSLYRFPPSYLPRHPTTRKEPRSHALAACGLHVFSWCPGGTYGTEEIIHARATGHGMFDFAVPSRCSGACRPAFHLRRAIDALHLRGCYYAWVRARASGNASGAFQEAWLFVLAASIF